MQGRVFVAPRTSALVAKARAVPCHEPGGGGRRAQRLAALGQRLRASALGSTPLGVGVCLGLGDRLPPLSVDGWPRPVCQGRNRQAARGAVCLGEGEPGQGLWPVGAPLPAPGHGWGLLLGGLPAFPIPARRRLARVRGHPCEGSGARGHRVPPRELRRLTLRPAPAGTAWTIRRCRDRTPRSQPAPLMPCPAAVLRPEAAGSALLRILNRAAGDGLPQGLRPVTPTGSQPPCGGGKACTPSGAITAPLSLPPLSSTRSALPRTDGWATRSA